MCSNLARKLEPEVTELSNDKFYKARIQEWDNSVSDVIVINESDDTVLIVYTDNRVEIHRDDSKTLVRVLSVHTVNSVTKEYLKEHKLYISEAGNLQDMK